MNRIIVRLPLKEYQYLNEFFPDETIYEILHAAMKLKTKITDNREKVTEIIYEIVPDLNRECTREALAFKRKIYNTFEVSGLDMFYKISIPEEKLEFIKKDNMLRIKYNEELIKLKEMIIKNDMIMKDSLEKLLVDETFKDAIQVSNQKLYECIYKYKTLKKSQYLTILKYLRKMCTCCTPSFIWSGITEGEFVNENIKLAYSEQNSEIYKVGDITQININNRINFLNEFKKKDDYFFSNTYFYVNTTAYICENGSIKYFKFTKLNKELLQINVQFLNEFLKEIKFCRFSFQEFLDFYQDKKFERDAIIILIEKLLEIDFFRPDIEIPLNNSVLKMKIEEIESTDSDKFNFNYYLLKHPLKKMKVSCDIKNELEKAYSIYAKLYIALRKNHEKIITKRLIDFYGETEISLLDFLHGKNPFQNINAESSNRKFNEKTFNYRSWNGLKKACTDNVNILVEFLSSKIKLNPNSKELIVDSQEVFNLINIPPEFKNRSLCQENVSQIDFDKRVIIPEMHSTRVGKLAGRFLNFIDLETRDELEKGILKSLEGLNNITQVNVQIYSHKDSLAFDLPFINKKLCLYDHNVESNKFYYDIRDIYLVIKDQEIYLRDKCGEKIHIYNNSSLSSMNDMLYTLLINFEAHNDFWNINGHSFSRIELDLDYQPRILIDNLLISRERFRISKSILIELFDKNNEIAHLNFLEFIYERNFPYEVYIYSDTDYKAWLCSFKTSLDINLIKSIVNSSKEYLYFEEVYPNKDTNKNYIGFNMEVYSQLCINN